MFEYCESERARVTEEAFMLLMTVSTAQIG